MFDESRKTSIRIHVSGVFAWAVAIGFVAAAMYVCVVVLPLFTWAR